MVLPSRCQTTPLVQQVWVGEEDANSTMAKVLVKRDHLWFGGMRHLEARDHAVAVAAGAAAGAMSDGDSATGYW